MTKRKRNTKTKLGNGNKSARVVTASNEDDPASQHDVASLPGTKQAASAASVEASDREIRPSISSTDDMQQHLRPPEWAFVIPSLHEEIAFYEGSVLTLKKRNEKLLLNLNQARSKRTMLEQRQRDLLERKAKLQVARIQHLTLKHELKSSLHRSRDRLARLTNMEDNEQEELKEEYWNEAETQGFHEKGTNVGTLSSELGTDTKDVFGEKAFAEGAVRQQETTMKPWSTTLVKITQDKKILQQFRSRHHSENLMTFLPCLGVGPHGEKILGKLITLSMRDASAFDDQERRQPEHFSGGCKENYNTNNRRKLLWNTCLDLFQLGNKRDKHEHERQLEGQPTNASESKGLEELHAGRVDPNISLCPYELTGVCADAFCPYQHVAKKSLIPRERLPLPALTLPSHKHRHGQQEPQMPRRTERLGEQECQKTTEEPVHEGAGRTGKPDNENVQISEMGSDEREIESATQLEDAKKADEDDNTRSSASEENPNEVFGLDFVALPFVEDASVEADGNDDEDGAVSNGENDIVTTYLDGIVQFSASHSRIWWETLESRIESEPEATPSVMLWLSEVAGFQITTSSSEQEDKLILEYGHAIPQTSLDYVQWFGRLVDACRVAIHAGRFDVVFSLLELATDTETASLPLGIQQGTWGSLLENDGVEFSPHALIHLLSQIVNTAFCFDGQRQSCFQSAFANQTAMAIVSESIRYTHEFYKDISMQTTGSAPTVGAENSETSTIDWGLVMRLVEAVMGVKVFAEFDSSDDVCDSFVATFKRELNSSTRLSAQGRMKEIPGRGGQGSSLDKMRANVVWALKVLNFQGCTILSSVSVNRLEDGIIRPCWLLVRNFCRRCTTNDRPWECLRATILMGHVILGSLSACVHHLNGMEGTLNANTTMAAALTTLDTTVYRILLEWYDLVEDIPMIVLLLTPLFAASISTAAFLRHYDASQNRLQSLLLDDRKSTSRLRKTTGSSCTSLTPYSEFLWSQLVHLRFSLPSLSGAQPARDIASPKKKKHRFSWDLSEGQIEESMTLARCISDYKVALHHVTLDGDWNLCRAMKEKSENLDQWGLAASKIQGALLDGKVDEESGQEHGLEINLSHLALHCRQHTEERWRESAVRTPIPQSILLSGHLFESLNLEGCNIRDLPASFGIYFPTLSRLNISRNNLQNLPESFGRMSCLQSLLLDSNLLESLPSSIGDLVDLKRLAVADNLLGKLPRTLYKCFQLEDLDVHNNCLWLQAEQEVGEMSLADLALKLPSLRSIRYLPQHERLKHSAGP